MKFANDGLSLWYGTPDAPAPLDEVVERYGASVVAGVHPANPTNAVNVQYRVDGGLARSAPGRELSTDYARNVQYFLVPFPPFPVGSSIEYCPVLSCAGRQTPPRAMVERFPSRFQLAPSQPSEAKAPLAGVRHAGPKLTPLLDFVASVEVRIDTPLVVGDSPEGARIDFFALDGTVEGPKICGRVLARSSDHMFVRPDGVGIIRVRAIIATDDGAMLEFEDTGSIDFGADGYQRALANALPARSKLVICPRVLTGSPKYLWLNRLQFLGVGSTRLDELRFHYDFFAVGSRAVATGG